MLLHTVKCLLRSDPAWSVFMNWSFKLWQASRQASGSHVFLLRQLWAALFSSCQWMEWRQKRWSYSPFQADIRQGSIESDHLGGHEVELVDLEHFLHLLLVVFRDNDGFPSFAGSIPWPGKGIYHGYTHTIRRGRRHVFPGRFPAHPLSRAVLVPLCCHTCCIRWSRAEWTYPASPRPARWPGPLYSRQTSSSWMAEKKEGSPGKVEFSFTYFFKVLQEISPSLACSSSIPASQLWSQCFSWYIFNGIFQANIWHSPSQWMSERVKRSGGRKLNSVGASGTMGKRLFI